MHGKLQQATRGLWKAVSHSRLTRRAWACPALCCGAANADFIPDYEAALDVKDFGAKGDGKTGAHSEACVAGGRCLQVLLGHLCSRPPRTAPACAPSPPTARASVLHRPLCCSCITVRRLTLRCFALPHIADDTKAFLAAIANASAQAAASGKGVAVAVPPGQYRITRQLTIDASRVVLRGSGVSGATWL